MGKIVWLASYPKSGNTWFRVFLTNLRGEQNIPADINDLYSTPIASTRPIFDEAVGLEASDLTYDEIDRIRPELYEKLAADTDETLFMKVHDAFTRGENGRPIFPKAATLGAIYLIRNPLDVAVSLAHYSGCDYEKSVARMSDKREALCGKTGRLHDQLRQKLLTWSGHVKSWTEQADFPVCVIRYEDMTHSPLDTFGRAVRFSGLDHDATRIEKALSLSSFERLQQQEAENNFKEKSPTSERFFRKGKIGDWRTELCPNQADRIVRDHRDVMKRYGYL